MQWQRPVEPSRHLFVQSHLAVAQPPNCSSRRTVCAGAADATVRGCCSHADRGLDLTLHAGGALAGASVAGLRPGALTALMLGTNRAHRK